MPNLFLFTGENAFALRREAKRWRTEFIARHGAENATRLDAEKLSLRRLLDEVSSLPFLAAKRLVFIDGLVDLEPEEWQTLRTQMHPDVLVVVLDARDSLAASRRKPTVTKAAKNGVEEVREFPLLKRRDLEVWLKQEAQTFGLSLSSEDVRCLLSHAGEDQGLLSTEIEKIALLRSANPSASTNDIGRLLLPSAEGVAWHITDALGQGKTRAALAAAMIFLERGGEPWQLWNTLLSMVKSLTLLQAAVTAGHSDVHAASGATGVTFFSARSLFPLAQRVDQRQLATLVQELCDADIALKSGALRASDEHAEELESVVLLAMMRMAQA